MAAARALLTAAAVSACWGVVATVLGGAGSQAWRELAAGGPPLPEDVVTLVASAAAVLVTGCWALGALLTAAVAAGGTDQRLGRPLRWACSLTPGLLRRAVCAAVGVAIVAGGASPAAAATAGGALDPAWWPTAATAPAEAGPAQATPAQAAAHAPARAPARPAAEVVVRPGDTLWDLAARRLGRSATPAAIAAEWPRWHAANRAVVGDDPDRLLPGQRLRVPGAGDPS